MGNSCTSVFPNTRAWEQQDRNKTMKQRKKEEENKCGKKYRRQEKRSPGAGLSKLRTNCVAVS